MSNKSSLRVFVVLLFAVFASAALVAAEAGALGQNSNSSTTGDDTAQNANDSMMAKPRRGGRRDRRGRRGQRSTAADANANADAGMAADAGVAADTMEDARPGDLSGEQVDLSGTYTGNLSTTGVREVGNGASTLTINGNQFTLENEGKTHSGRVYAVTTRGYVGAALYFSDIIDPATSTPVVVNVRARKSGERLTLSPIRESSAKLTFAPGRGRH